MGCDFKSVATRISKAGLAAIQSANLTTSKDVKKILLSAYACEPGKGSEPGVGWKWIIGLAARVRLTVLTRSNNRDPIETEIAATPQDHPLRNVRFLYHDLPNSVRRLKRIGLLPTLPYYFLWQWTAARRFAREADASDIVHHLTFCTALCPGFWNRTKAARIIGPVAAPIVPAAYLPLFGPRKWTQALRNFLIRNFLRLPWLRRSFAGAAAVFPANSDMKHLLEDLNIACQPIMLDTGASDLPANHQSSISSGKAACLFLYAGVLERRKGLELALRAYSSFIQNPKFKIQNSSSLTFLGDGPDRSRLEALAASLGISEHVKFLGRVPHEEVARHFSDADIFVFTSVRDASGGVNLEAMAQGLPILCLAHQGVGDITDDTCAIRIPTASIDETIQSLADGMRQLAGNPDLRRQLSQCARTRAVEMFSWQEKFDRMDECYRDVVR